MTFKSTKMSVGNTSKKIVVTTVTFTVLILRAHLGVFSILDQQQQQQKWYETEELWDKTAQTKEGGLHKRFYRGHKCLRERKRVATKYHVIESYREKREWKMFATKKVMKTAAEEATEISRFLPTPLQTPLGTWGGREWDNYLQYLRRVHLPAKERMELKENV